MANYRAIVSISFDDEDLEDLAEMLGVEIDRMNAHEALDGSLDNLEFGTGWIEQLFVNGKPTIHNLSNGVMVEVSEHDA